MLKMTPKDKGRGSMLKKIFRLFGVATFLIASGHSVQATTYKDVTLGGVNLTAYCSKIYGYYFKAKLIQNHAGGWTCEKTAGNRRPISVKKACILQYGHRAYKAKALNWTDPTSWRCFARQAIPTMTGVNLTPWCQKTFGSTFKAKLIQNHAGGWTCEQSSGNRRPISVIAACRLQHGSRAYKATALNWNDPYSWKCLVR